MGRKNLISTALLLCLCGLYSCGKKQAGVETQLFSSEDIYALKENTEATLRIHTQIEFPIALQNQGVLFQIQTKLIAEMFGKNYISFHIEEAILEWKKESKLEYMQNNLPLFDMLKQDENETIGALCNEHHLTVKPVFQNKNVLSYVIVRYVYMGGAHGLNTHTFYNFCLHDGSLITENKLFTSHYKEELTATLLKKLYDDTDNESIQMCDYYDENVIPNNNFYISNEGITYFYNPYDIAAYACGDKEIFISKEQLEPLLSKQGKLYFFGTTIP